MSGRPSDLQVRLHYASNRFGMGKNVVGIESLLDEAAETIAALEADRLAALAPVTADSDTARLDYIERTFSGMTNRERYLPVQMIWGKGAMGRTLREACDKYMSREQGEG